MARVAALFCRLIDVFTFGALVLKLVVELKSVQSLLIEHELQLVNYLKGLKRDIGLLINFGPSGVDVKRKFMEFDKEK